MHIFLSSTVYSSSLYLSFPWSFLEQSPVNASGKGASWLLLHIQTHTFQDMKSLLHEGDMKLDRQFDKRVYGKSSLAVTRVRENTSVNHKQRCPDKEISAHTEAEYARMAGNSEEDTIHPNSNGEAKKSNSSEVDDGTIVDDEVRKASLDPVRRVEQRSQEVRNKLQALGQYGTPSPLRNLKSPATVNARKPFRAPFKQQ